MYGSQCKIMASEAMFKKNVKVIKNVVVNFVSVNLDFWVKKNLFQ